MAQIKVRVGAAVDRDLATVFRPLIEAAHRARQQVQAELNAGAKALGHPYRTSAREAASAVGSIGSSAKRSGAVLGTVADGARKKFEDLSKGLRRIPVDLATVAAEAERELRRMERAQARSALGLRSGGDGGRFAHRVGYWSMRNFAPVTPMLSVGARAAREIARGAGVDFSLSTLVGHSVEQQSAATKLAVQGYTPWSKSAANATRQDPSALVADAHAVAKETGIDRGEVLAAMGKFVDLTGDLETARGVMMSLGRISNATGADLQDMAGAAGEVSNKLDQTFGADKQAKLKAMDSILRSLAAQGKAGAVEIKDYARQMPKIAAAAGAFEGGPEGLFNLLGMMTQESRKGGGSASPTQAATSVAAFARDVVKNANKFEKFRMKGRPSGIEVWADGAHTKLASPEKIIEASILQTRGNLTALRSLFPNSMSFRAVQGFANVYNEAETKETGSGKAALEAEMSALRSAVLTEKDVAEGNAAIMETTAKKAAVFQNQLQDIADKAVTKLIPAFEQLAPKVLTLADEIGTFVSWAAANPGLGIGAALAASIAKAGVENLIRGGIERLFAASSANAAINGGSSGIGGASLQAAGAGLAIATAAVTIASVGMLAIDHVADQQVKEQRTAFSEDMQALNAANQARAEIRSGNVSEGTRRTIEQKILNLESRIESARHPTSALEAAAGWVTAGKDFSARSRERADADRLASLNEQLTKLHAVMFDIKRQTELHSNRVQQVQIVNAPTVDANTRAPFATPVGH